MLKRSQNLNIKDQRKGKPNYLLISFAVFLCFLILFSIALTMVVRATDFMLRRPRKEINILAENLVPTHDTISFQSLDKNALLSAWYFQAMGPVRGNIILVHDNLNNRLQFDLETAELYSFLRNSGFNVLAFDLRHSGQSSGEISAYGYMEYLDVLAALREVQRLSNNDKFILMGFGSGCVASLLAWEALPEKPQAEADRPYLLRDVELCKDNIQAMIFDTIAASADDYIRAEIKNEGFLNRFLYYPFIPTAVRLSASHEKAKLSPLLAQVQAPVMITRNLPESHLDEASIEAVIRERLRLKHELTYVWETQEAGSISGWLLDPENYRQHLSKFLDRWFSE
ncbi:MAG: hypothetical protein Q4P08_03420 [Eubacteriales bacterium]|nr:hypothetical protein [Eubacteriales bacterium]